MKPIRIKTIKGVMPGLQLPGNRLHPGQNARFVESEYKKVQYYNDGAGVDLPEFDTELKTRMTHSKSAHTAGRMTTKNIIKTSWPDSSVFKKLQRQQRPKLNTTFEEVTSNLYYDFTDPDIQKEFQYAYEMGRQEIASGLAENNTKTYGWGLWEKDKGKEQWAFRITDAGMKKAEAMSKQQFHKLFEEVDND